MRTSPNFDSLCRRVATTVFVVLLGCLPGCAYYTLEDADPPVDGDFRLGDVCEVAKPAVLVPETMFTAVGFDHPTVTLDSFAFPQIGRRKIMDVPKGSAVLLEHYARFHAHGYVDCGYDNAGVWIGKIVTGPAVDERCFVWLDREPNPVVTPQPRQSPE